MAFEEPVSVPDHRLIASAVYDQSGNYQGTVVKVDRVGEGPLSLLIQRADPQSGQAEFRVDGEAIQHVDVDHKIVYIDLDQVGHQTANPSRVEPFPLWQERLVVNRNRRKVGEVSLRKVTETQKIEIPIRSEKLVVESVETGDILAEVGLSNTRITEDELSSGDLSLDYEDNHVVRGHLLKLKDATSFLEAINQFPDNRLKKIRVVLMLLQGSRSETIAQVFDSAKTALEVLAGMPSFIADQCGDVYVEALVNDRERATTYRNWLSRYKQPNLRPQTQRPTTVTRVYEMEL